MSESKEKLTINLRNECYYCIHRRRVPGNCHIQCENPDADMTGDPYGIKSGWFIYPSLFDPVWKTKKCENFTKMQEGKDENI